METNRNVVKTSGAAGEPDCFTMCKQCGGMVTENVPCLCKKGSAEQDENRTPGIVVAYLYLLLNAEANRTYWSVKCDKRIQYLF